MAEAHSTSKAHALDHFGHDRVVWDMVSDPISLGSRIRGSLRSVRGHRMVLRCCDVLPNLVPGDGLSLPELWWKVCLNLVRFEPVAKAVSALRRRDAFTVGTARVGGGGSATRLWKEGGDIQGDRIRFEISKGRYPRGQDSFRFPQRYPRGQDSERDIQGDRIRREISKGTGFVSFSAAWG